MKTSEFKNLKKGDLVFYVANSGMAGIFKYQYIGIFNCHGTNEEKHVFLSEYFLSTVTILTGREDSSRQLKSIFLTEKEAKIYHKNLID